MKRILTIIITLFICHSYAHSQKKIDKELWFGAKGGVTFSNLSIAPNINQSMEMGMLGGATMRYIEERFFGIILELNYAQKGWKEDFKDSDPQYKYSRTLNYIEFPFLAHVYFGKKSFRFFVNLGPQIGVCIGEKTESNFDIEKPQPFSIPRETTHLNKSIDKPFDYGLTGGLGCEIRIKNRHSILVEGRYYFGLADIFNNKSDDYFSVSSNQSILVALTYQYNIKNKKKK